MRLELYQNTVLLMPALLDKVMPALLFTAEALLYLVSSSLFIGVIDEICVFLYIYEQNIVINHK